MRFAKYIFLVFIAYLTLTGTRPASGQAAEGGLGKDLPNISINVKDVSLEDILRMFSRQSGLNFVASDIIKDKLVTLYMRDVPVEVALSSIMEAHNLTYDHPEGTAIYIVKEATAEEEKEIPTVTRVFYLTHARVTNYRFKPSGTASDSGEGIPDMGIEEEQQPKGIEEVVKQLLSPRGSVVSNQRTNSLIVTDTEEKLDEVAQVIAELDKPTPQILVEVEVVDTTKQVADNIGIKYGSSTGEIIKFTGPQRSMNLGFIPFKDEKNRFTDDTFTAGTLTAQNFEMVLEMLNKDTNTDILARPKVFVMDNETAIIKIVKDAAIGQLSTTTASEGTSTATNQAEREEVGISMRVTPQINENGYVTMLIEPRFSETVASSVLSNTEDPEVRAVQTKVRIKSGNVVVIGGFMKTKDTEVVRKVPLFGSIPLLGALFTHKDIDKENRELLFFITPRIAEEDDLDFRKGAAKVAMLSGAEKEEEIAEPKIAEAAEDRRTSEMERAVRELKASGF